MKRAAAALMGLSFVLSVVVILVRDVRHFSEPWPAHMLYHVLHHLAVIAGLCLVSLAVVVGPFWRGEPWAWWVLAVSGAFLFGGLWLANLTLGPPPGAALVQGVLTALFLAGLALGRAALHPGAPSA